MYKKCLLTAAYFTIFTFASLEAAVRFKPIESQYENALNQLQKHLEETVLSTTDRNNLINKLKGYFCPATQRSDIFLKDQAAAQMYSSIIKSYNELMQSQKNYPSNNGIARKFAEQAVGKILLFCSSRRK